MKRAATSVSPTFAVWLNIGWCALLCFGAGRSFVFRHDGPAFAFARGQPFLVGYDVLFTYVPLGSGILVILGLLGRCNWARILSVMLNLALASSGFAMAAAAYWMSVEYYGRDVGVLTRETLGIPTIHLIVLTTLLLPSVKRGFR